MLDITIKKLLINTIPANITVDGYSFPIKKTLGSVPLNELSLPTVNLKFIGEGTPFSRSIDDECVIGTTTTSYKNVYMCTLRYTIGAIDTTINTSSVIKYTTGTDSYTLPRVPVKNIVSITGYVENTNYRLSVNRDSIEWIGSHPANNANFTVNYNWINQGFYISHQLVDYLMKDVRGRVYDLLAPYGINIIDVKGVTDISHIYSNDALSAFSFDIIITYPYTWTTIISAEDATTANTIELDLTVNDIDAGTITYTRT